MENKSDENLKAKIFQLNVMKLDSKLLRGGEFVNGEYIKMKRGEYIKTKRGEFVMTKFEHILGLCHKVMKFQYFCN